MQHSNQKLWPFSVVLLVWQNKTSASSSRDSIGRTRKMGFGNYCKNIWARSNRWIKSDGPFQLLFRSGTTRPPLHRVGIPKILQGKRVPETTLKLLARSNNRIKSYSLFLLLFSSSMTRPLLPQVGIPYVEQGKRGFENYCNYLSTIQRSDQKLWPFSAVIRVWRDKTSSSPSKDSIGTLRKTRFGNNCKYLRAIQRSDQKLRPFSAVIPVWRAKPLVQREGIP
jgi:hypothetical protein